MDLPGGATRFDYQDVDTGLGHLVLAHMNDGSVLFVDLSDGSVLKELTGIPVAMHIHSPAGVGTNAGVLVNLLPFNIPAANAALGGTIIVSGAGIFYPTNSVSDLLAGLAYINIHTALNPGGEVRGQ